LGPPERVSAFVEYAYNDFGTRRITLTPNTASCRPL